MTGSFMILLGAGYLLSAFLFVGAAQWQSISEWQMLVFLLVGFAALVLIALCAGVTSLTGEIALIGATLFTGLLLFFVDRIYLNSTTNFGALLVWPIVILPWLALSRSPAHWILWTFLVAVLLGVALSTYLIPPGSALAPLSPFIVAAVPALALYGAETLRIAGWPRNVLLAALLGILYAALIPHLFPVVRMFEAYDAGAASIVVYSVTIALSVWYYRFRAPDRGGFAIAISFASLALAAIGSRYILDRFGQNPLDPSGRIGWLFLLIWISACMGATAALLRRQFRAASSGEDHAR